MAPLNYSDITKSVNDLFGKDFPSGIAKLEVKTFASDAANFTITGTQDQKSGGIIGEIKAKHINKPNGLTITNSWTTNNIATTQFEIIDKLADGLKLDVSASLFPHSGQKTGKAGIEYKQENVNFRSYFHVLKNPQLNTDLVFGRDRFLAGAEVGYDVMDGRVTKYGLTGVYKTLDYAVGIQSTQSLSLHSLFYHHRINKDIEAAARASYDTKANGAMKLEVATKYALDEKTYAKAKVNSEGVVGLGLTQVLRPGLKFSLGGNFDTVRLGENNHKFGFAVTLEN